MYCGDPRSPRLGVRHAHTPRRLDGGLLATRRRRGKRRKPRTDFGARAVEDAHRQKGDARALIAHGKVDALLGDRDGSRLDVDDLLVAGGRATSVGGDSVDQFVALWLPWRRLPRGGVKLIVEQAEGFFTAKRLAREE